ncbi:MAG: FHA domain-containing protein, partial [Planctomycetota bacterium]
MALLFPTSPGPRIKPIEVPGLAKPIDLVRAPDGSAALTVGRGADNDVALDGDSWPSVSTTHARFELRGEELWVVDLDSSNGVLVGGERIDFEARLDVGDQVRLGSVGPRFLVVSGRGLSDTVFVRREAANGGAPEEAVQASEERTRRMVRRTGAAVGVAALAGLAVLAWFQFGASRREGRTQKELESARAQIAALEERQSDRERKERQDRLGRERRIAELERQATELEGTLELQRGEEARLLERIDELESQQASREEVARVEAELARTRADLVEARADLVTTREKVDMFDPVNLAQARLSGVSRVRQSIVLIENETRVHERETGRTMHLDTRGGVPVPNFEGVGEEFVVGSTGSGFCVDGDGHVLTNQHVIDEPKDMPLELFAQDEKFEVRQTLEVVFSGTKRRIPARVVSTSPSGEDLALLVIEPFEGMP